MNINLIIVFVKLKEPINVLCFISENEVVVTLVMFLFFLNSSLVISHPHTLSE